MANQDYASIERVLWPTGRATDIWMIVDAARDRRIFGMLLDCFYSTHTCLFSGPLVSDLEVAAPYLIRLEYDAPKTKRFVTQAWGNEWGVFLKCDLGLGRLARHLRDLLVVRDPKGNSLLFRYYDPRVLRVYLPTCTRDELGTVFGGIECFWIEDAEAGTVLNARVGLHQLLLQKLPLGA